MHPAEHRGLRELFIMTRQMRHHWRTLAQRLDGTASGEAQLLRDGSDVARGLLGELTDVAAARDLYGGTAAQGFGARLATLHSGLVDTLLEVNQALRFAALDVVHVVTLLDYLTGLARAREDAELETFLTDWAQRMRTHEDAIRAAAVALGDEPSTCVVAAAPGLAGRLGHGAAAAIGTAGEWFDRRAAPRTRPRPRPGTSPSPPTQPA